MLSIFKRTELIPVVNNDKKYRTKHNPIGQLFNKTKPKQINLYFGGQFNQRKLKKLRDLGITTIVNMRSQSVLPDMALEEFKYFHLPTPDNHPPSLDMLIEGAEFIDNEIRMGGKVYINCLKGRGRGPTMAIAYLIKAGRTFDDAHRLITNLKPDICISHLQLRMLQELENYYKESVDESNCIRS